MEVQDDFFFFSEKEAVKQINSGISDLALLKVKYDKQSKLWLNDICLNVEW